MALEFIPTRNDYTQSPNIQNIIGELQGRANALGIDGGVLYYGWPNFLDYESVAHPVDIAVLSRRTGLILVRVIDNINNTNLEEEDESITQAAATAESQMLKSPILRGPRRRLKFEVTPLIYAPGADGLPLSTAELSTSEASLFNFFDNCEDQELTERDLEEARSILEGAKALGKSARRKVVDPNATPVAYALANLEDRITKFDAQQRSVALTTLPCPQRIRGLAGSGKTVILAMKAALAHIANPEANILVTFYTRSLRDHLTRMITRFYRHFAEGEPDWKKIHVRHGWGQRDLPGVYRSAATRAGVIPMTFGDVKSQPNPFDFACKALVDTGLIRPYYDMVLIDEGQDFPEGFYRLCFFLAKGDRDLKQIIWAYDELQDIFDVRVRTSEELFGRDTDGAPRISLARSLPGTAETNDFVLSKCYRNQRDVLVLAHAIGFGLYSDPVQMLQDEEHWKDVGYEVLQGSFRPGSRTVIHRPIRNSPAVLETPVNRRLIDHVRFDHVKDEIDFCVSETQRFIADGLQPHDIMIVSIDDRAARMYLSEISSRLAARGIESNNIIADKFSEPPFLIEGKVTLSTVYRAKGNEAALVFVIGCDAVSRRTRTGRNRIFTAFTRTKGWLRVTGIGPRFQELADEIAAAMNKVPNLEFEMPDPAEIELIHRDLAERDARLIRAKEQMERLKGELGLTDSDLRDIIGD